MKSFLRIVFVLAVCFSTVAFAATTKKTKKDALPEVKLPSVKPKLGENEKEKEKNINDFKAEGDYKSFVGAAEEYKRGVAEFAAQKANKTMAKNLGRYEKRLKEKKDRCYNEAQKITVQ